MASQGELLKARYDRLLARRQPYEWIRQEVAEYVLPHRAVIGESATEGASRTDKIFDATAMHANALLGARIHGALFNPAAKNFTMATRDAALNKDYGIRKWFDAAETAMQLAINLSNFSSAAHEVCLETPALGTSALYAEERLPKTKGFNGLNFRSFSLSEFVIDENADGEVDTLMRAFKLSARAAVRKWPGCSAGTREKAEKKPEELVDFLHAMYPRETKDATTPTPAEKKAWASIYMELKPLLIVEEGGMEECPFGVIRWSLTPGEVYGFGPGMAARPDIKTLNKSVELFLQQWALAIQPPVFTTLNNCVGSPQFTPGSRIPVRRLDAIREFVTNARFDVTMAGIEGLRKAVRDMFFGPQLELKASPEMTATEVAARMQLMNQFLGPVSGRFMSELLTPILIRCFGIMSRFQGAGAPFPPVPPRLQAYVKAQGDFEIRYLTPMARQQRQPELAAIERFTQMLLATQQLHPAGLDRIDFDGALGEAADILGVPASVLRSDQELATVRAAKAQVQEQAAQLAAMQSVAQAAGQAAPMVSAISKAQGNGG